MGVCQNSVKKEIKPEIFIDYKKVEPPAVTITKENILIPEKLLTKKRRSPEELKEYIENLKLKIYNYVKLNEMVTLVYTNVTSITKAGAELRDKFFKAVEENNSKYLEKAIKELLNEDKIRRYRNARTEPFLYYVTPKNGKGKNGSIPVALGAVTGE